jgi:hypothetical protein
LNFIYYSTTTWKSIEDVKKMLPVVLSTKWEPNAGVAEGTRLGHGMGFRHGGIAGKAGHCGH